MSRVIRGAASRVVSAELASARNEGDREIVRAREEASRIIEEAQSEAKRVREEARHEGLAAAHLEAARTLLEASRCYDAALLAAERNAQTLALLAASQIVGESLALEPDRVIAIVRNALSRTRQAHACEVRVHPNDIAALQKATFTPEVRIVPDESITRGGCIVRNALGTIDARIEVRIDAMARLLGCEAP